MDLIQTHLTYNFNSIILSKIVLYAVSDIPKIKKLSLFYFINNKQYKKNILLFYVIISLILGGALTLKKKEVENIYIFKIVLIKKKVNNFIICFINIYMPLIDIAENLLKQGILSKKKLGIIYRINFFHSPAIIELDSIYTNFESAYSFANNYRLQIDIFIKTKFYIKNLLEFVPRMYRVPCIFKF
jgi:hypothetical protein